MIVYKYQVNHGLAFVSLPIRAKVLTVRYQNSFYGKGFFFWALIDKTEKAFERRKFLLITTGLSDSQLDKSGYIGSVETDTKEIFHLFELKG